jgi:hypothetical protein
MHLYVIWLQITFPRTCRADTSILSNGGHNRTEKYPHVLLSHKTFPMTWFGSLKLREVSLAQCGADWRAVSRRGR